MVEDTEDADFMVETDPSAHTKAKGNYLSQVILCWGIQMTLCMLLFGQVISQTDENGSLIIASFPVN
jgi:hypothetical protein